MGIGRLLIIEPGTPAFAVHTRVTKKAPDLLRLQEGKSKFVGRAMA
jgi:hypothetical protein